MHFAQCEVNVHSLTLSSSKQMSTPTGDSRQGANPIALTTGQWASSHSLHWPAWFLSAKLHPGYFWACPLVKGQSC